MGLVHFLDVGQGDCSIIEHPSRRITIIDVSKARSSPPPPRVGLGEFLPGLHRPSLLTMGLVFASPTPSARSGATLLTAGTVAGLMGLATALETTENPIRYMHARGITDVFRFILTHPDMDHMDGIKDVFDDVHPINFWDTENKCTKSFPAGSRYRREDWLFYKGLRDGTHVSAANILTLYSGAKGPYYNQGVENDKSHDGLHVLAPTPELVAHANRTGDFNDASYVILYRSAGGRILFCGDASDKTWDHLLANHLAAIRNVEVMIAPHHGRDPGQDRRFLDEVRPKLTLFGVAPSEHLAYDAWSSRDLAYITNNQAGNIIIETNNTPMQVYVSKETFARERYPGTTYSPELRAWYLRYIA